MKPPNGVHLVKVSSSSFTVASKAATGARGYRLFVSTTKGDLYAGRLGSARASRLYPTPMLSIAHLPYAATPYYYRLAAVNGSKRSFSATIGSVGLVPAVPTNLVVSTTALGTSLTWSSAPATGYRILASSSPTMASPQTFTITGLDKQFTPYGLTKGQTYYFQVAALNGTTASPLTAPVATPVPVMTSEQHVSVMSYNILELTTDGTKEGDGTVAPWSQRVVAVANLIQKASPDVVAIQEGAPWVGGVKGPRQVDSLVSQLGGDYSLASTEVPPSQANYFRTGDYILYKNSAYQPIGVGNHWNLPDAHFAAYQVLQNTTTGAKFLFVAPHMIVGNGATFDQQREDETNSMLTQVSQFMSSNPMPVVYAGDFNTDLTKEHAFDGPGIAMRAQDIDDAYDVAQTQTNTQYNSANDYYRTPPQFGDHIDYVFAPPGVAITSVSLLLNLSGGKFVGVIPSDHNPVLADVVIPY